MAPALESASHIASQASLPGSNRDASTTPAPITAIASTRPGAPRSWPNAERRTADRPVRRAGISEIHAGNHSGYASHAETTSAPASTTANATNRREGGSEETGVARPKAGPRNKARVALEAGAAQPTA